MYCLYYGDCLTCMYCLTCLPCLYFLYFLPCLVGGTNLFRDFSCELYPAKEGSYYGDLR